MWIQTWRLSLVRPEMVIFQQPQLAMLQVANPTTSGCRAIRCLTYEAAHPRYGPRPMAFSPHHLRTVSRLSTIYHNLIALRTVRSIHLGEEKEHRRVRRRDCVLVSPKSSPCHAPLISTKRASAFTMSLKKRLFSVQQGKSGELVEQLIIA